MVLVPFYRGAVVFDIARLIYNRTEYVLVPFYRGAVVFNIESKEIVEYYGVLVPFYRGAVVFTRHATPREIEEYEFSSPFIEERLYLEKVRDYDYNNTGFSSPFIEERLYLE